MQLYRVLHGIIRDNSFDLVHSNGTLADVLTIPIAMYLRKPILSTCHGLIATRTRLVLYNYLNRRILRFSNAVIAVSDTIRVDLEKSGVKGSRISVIPNALCGDQDHDSENANRVMIRERLGISEKDFVIGYVGRLSEEKGLEYLIKATAIVIERNPQVKLLIIGEGPDRNKLKIIAHRENIDKNIYFMGFHTNISPWLSAMDLFVLPSLTEGTPMALLEAMAHGLPVAASCVGGIPDIVNSGKNGILFDAANPNYIALVICDMLKNESIRINLGREAKRTIRSKYNVMEWARSIEKVYLELLH